MVARMWAEPGRIRMKQTHVHPLVPWTLALGLALVLPSESAAREHEGGPLRVVKHYDIGAQVAVPLARTQAGTAGVVYFSNVTTPLSGALTQGPASNVGSNGMTRLVADDISGVLPGGDVREITFTVANLNPVTVTCRPRLRFWNSNGSGGVPGTYLGSVGFTFPAFPFPPGVTIATGGVPAGVFPMPVGTFWSGIVFDNENGTTGATLTELGNIGQALFDPPTLGTSPDVLFETNSAGSFLGTNNPAGARVSQASGPRVSVGWKFSDVPCPTIVATSGPHGSIAPSGTVPVDCGADQTFVFSPSPCYEVADVLVDDVSVGPVSSYEFQGVVENHTISATFAFIGGEPLDSDGDGLSDEWETLGVPLEDGSGNRYVLPGSDPMHKDLYVEVDAMTGHLPDSGALADVVAAFAQSPVCNPDETTGIRLHLVSDGCDPCLDDTNVPEASWPEWSPANEPAIFADIHAVKAQNFGTSVERAEPDVEARLTAKAKGYRYCIFGKSIGSPSGIAERGGDFAVTLDPVWFAGVSRDKWAGTFMHELGHSLGLGHGGADGVNMKPNYYSVMNYIWQWPVVFNGQGVDWNSAYRRSWVLDYSRSALHPLTESDLDEMDGIGGSVDRVVPIGPPRQSIISLRPWFKLVPMGGPVDWNDDGKADDSGVSRDINFFDLPGQTAGVSTVPLAPSDDWAALQYGPTEPFPSPIPQTAPALAANTPAESELTQAVFDSLSALHFDCNENDIEDAEEIANGTVEDVNENGIPDLCEGPALLVEVGGRGPTSALRLAFVPHGLSHDIYYGLPTSGVVKLRVFDLTGRLVSVLVDGYQVAGTHHASWAHQDRTGSLLAAGVYFVELRSGGEHVLGKVTVLR